MWGSNPRGLSSIGTWVQRLNHSANLVLMYETNIKMSNFNTFIIYLYFRPLIGCKWTLSSFARDGHPRIRDAHAQIRVKPVWWSRFERDMSVKRSWCGFERSQNLSGRSERLRLTSLKTPPWTFHANVMLKSTSSDGFNSDYEIVNRNPNPKPIRISPLLNRNAIRMSFSNTMSCWQRWSPQQPPPTMQLREGLRAQEMFAGVKEAAWAISAWS